MAKKKPVPVHELKLLDLLSQIRGQVKDIALEVYSNEWHDLTASFMHIRIVATAGEKLARSLAQRSALDNPSGTSKRTFGAGAAVAGLLLVAAAWKR